MNVIIIIFIVVFFECLGQGLLKHYNTNNQVCYFLIAVLCYIVVCFFLVESYNNNSIGSVACIWSGMTIVIMVLIGVVLYNEKLTFKDIIAISLIITGIFLIQYRGNGGKGFNKSF